MPRPISRAALALGLFIHWTAPGSRAETAVIDPGTVRQSIDGFGACTAWHGAIGDAEAAAAFGNETGQLGLSILRVRIDPSPNAWPAEKSNAQKAKARGAKILATPWTPPPALKTNNSAVGGELKPDQYGAYAAHLKGFCDALGNVDVVSVQNEPNIKVSYESCSWTGTQIRDFCKTQADAIGVPLMMPEAFNFDPSMSDPTLDDPEAAPKAPYVGGHLYGARPFAYAKAIDAGKKIWMTEFYINDESANGMLMMAKQILDCLANGMNAYVWWYLSMPGCNIIRRDGTLMRKGYAMAQFSKFIRPGYRRIEATYQPQPGVYVAAFQGDRTVIVAINQNPAAKSQDFALALGTLAAPRKYTSSAAKSLADEGEVELSGNAFTASLDAQSITTFVAVPTDAILARPGRRARGASSRLPEAGYLPTGRRLALPPDWRSRGTGLPILFAR